MTDDNTLGETKTEELKDWTIMIYLAGDNNLNQDTIDAIKGLKSNSSNPLHLTSRKIALLAYYDPSTISYPTLYCDFTHKNSLNANGDSFVNNESYQTTFGSSLEEGEESNEESIYRFVKWCVETQGHKAKNYALILSGHGYGFQKDTFMQDSNPGTYMTPKGLADKLKRVNRWILNENEKKDIKFSIIGLDSCVMSTIEFANQLSDVGETLIASQGLIPSTGWNYKHIVQQINNKQEIIEAENEKSSTEKSITNEELSRIIADSFITSNYENAFFGDRSIDISCCNLKQIPETSGLVHSLGRLLLFAINSPLKKKILGAILTSHQVCQKHILDQCVDLKDFCFNLKLECDSLILENTTNIGEISKIASIPIENIDESQTDNIITCLQKSNKFLGFISTNCSGIIQSIDGNDDNKGVTSNFNYLGSEYQYSNGLSLYFPWSYLSYRKTLPRYLEHQFAAQDFMDSGWLERQFYRFKNTPLKGKDEKKDKIKNELKTIHEHRFTPNFWTMFLEYYLFSTLRNVRSRAEKAYYLYNPEGESLHVDSLNDPRFRLNPLNKIWDDYDKRSPQSANMLNSFLKNEDSRFKSYKLPSIEFNKLSEKPEIKPKEISWLDEKWNDDNWVDESKWTESNSWFVDHKRWSKVDKWSSKDDKWKFDDGVWKKVEINSAENWLDNWSEDESKWASSNDEWFNNEKWTAKVDKWSKVDRWTAKVDKWTAKVDKWSKVDKWTSRDDRWAENNMSEFAKTNNFPWTPRFWQPSENVLKLWKENKLSENIKSSSVSEDENDITQAT